MNPISVILLICVFANTALAGFVLGRRHSRPVHFAFAVLVITIALWNTTNFVISLTGNLAVVVPVGRLAFLMGAVLLNVYLAFTWFFPETRSRRPRRSTVLAVLALAVVAVPLSGSTWVQADVIHSATGKQPVFGPLHALYVLYLLALFGWGSLNLLRSRLAAPRGRDRLQVDYSLAGFLLAFLVIAATQFLLPRWMPPAEYYLLGSASTLCWTTLTFYAIFRHRLMDIGVAFRNVLIRLLFAVLVTALVVLPFLLHRFAAAATPPLTPFLVTLAIALLLSACLPELHRRITVFVDQRLFRGRYDHKHALVRFGDQLLRHYGRDNVARLIAQQIPIILQAEGAAVYLPDDDGQDFLLLARDDAPGQPLELPELLSAGDPLLQALLSRRRGLNREDLLDLPAGRDGAASLAARFTCMHVSVAAPLVCQGQVLGLLLLGDKRQDNVFTSDDMELLGALASQAAIALGNARLHEEVLSSRRIHEVILRHMQQGVLAVNARLDVVTLNEAGAAMLGLQRQPCQGRPLAELVPEFAELVQRCLSARAAQPAAELHVHRASRAFPCECQTSLLSDAHNRVTGAMIVFQDLTERKRQAEQVRRMDRLASVGTLAAGLAHEIKNPLVSIQTFVQLLPERHADARFRDGFGDVVRGEIARINRLLQNLLEFARPQPRLIGPVHLGELVDRSLALLEHTLRREHIEVVLVRDPVLPIVRGDAERLHQVVFNLLQNAIQAFDQPPRTLTITLRRQPEDGAEQDAPQAVLLEVHDSGRGIAPADLPHIFDPFFTTKKQGSGLGLSICHSILTEHGARMDVRSPPGQGCTVSVWLPAQDGCSGREDAPSR